MNLEYLTEIKSKLLHGDIQKIADITGLSKASVGQHLAGRYKKPNEKVIETALFIITEHKAFDKKIKRRVKALTEN